MLYNLIVISKRFDCVCVKRLVKPLLAYFGVNMTSLLLKMFVKNYKSVESGVTRKNVGTLSSVVGIILNTLLATFKILVGALFGIISVLADGLNNLTDCGSNIVSLVSFKLSNKPADKEHPYGHQRIEYVASMVVAFIVLVLAFELGSESVNKIIALCKGESEPINFSLYTIIVLSVAILVKLWMFVFNRKLGKRYNSDLLKATAVDSISDVGATGAVLISVIVSHYTGFNLDGIMGVAVAIVIAVAGIKILKGAFNHLLGEAPDKELIESIVERIKKFDGVCGIHDLSVHNYGPNKLYASVHVEVDAEIPVLQSHEMIDQIERDFAENTNITLVIHLDPIVLNDPELDEYKREIAEIVRDIDEQFTIHDFRMVKGVKRTNLIFDVAITFDSKLTNEEITSRIQQEISNLHPEIYVVPTIEKTY